MPYAHLATFLAEPRADLSVRVDLWETGRTDWRGCSVLRYCVAFLPAHDRVVLFEGEDYSPGAATCDDSVENARALCSFLAHYAELGEGHDEAPTLKPAQWATLDLYADELSVLSCDWDEPGIDVEPYWTRFNGSTGEREPIAID